MKKKKQKKRELWGHHLKAVVFCLEKYKQVGRDLKEERER